MRRDPGTNNQHFFFGFPQVALISHFLGKNLDKADRNCRTGIKIHNSTAFFLKEPHTKILTKSKHNSRYNVRKSSSFFVRANGSIPRSFVKGRPKVNRWKTMKKIPVWHLRVLGRFVVLICFDNFWSFFFGGGGEEGGKRASSGWNDIKPKNKSRWFVLRFDK